ncbi:lariat debranching enzyme [Anaeramoeba flamelloides]|uniref:Lariat debranching enzyme n=1 Tax=Anaeramoeba flamelloides TaxID=1746091 RepID=A0AAV7ZET8_9EUKA|nr:lariat debranching enzyme [Anaeramoeba flamelloides]
MKIAVVGCVHGKLDKVYSKIRYLSKKNNYHIDLVIICGDFQTARNRSDLDSLCVKPKFKLMHDFHRYYSGEKTAPFLTIFVGGNHEASNYLQELNFGGWVAPNIYYLGRSGVINFNGLKIAGLSGIFKGYHLNLPYEEKCPYSNEEIRSIFHVRSLDIFRLHLIQRNIDIMITHDWPRGVTDHGDVNSLLKKKPFFRKDIETTGLGSPINWELLIKKQPRYYFCAHLHCKFTALIFHNNNNNFNNNYNNQQKQQNYQQQNYQQQNYQQQNYQQQNYQQQNYQQQKQQQNYNQQKSTQTQFLALDKPLPGRNFVEIMDIRINKDKELEFKEKKIANGKLYYDLEWLAILKVTQELFSKENRLKSVQNLLFEKNNFIEKVNNEMKEMKNDKHYNDLQIPENFQPSAPTLKEEISLKGQNFIPKVLENQQHLRFVNWLGITDPWEGLGGSNQVENSEEIRIDLNSLENNLLTQTSQQIIEEEEEEIPIVAKNPDEIDLDMDFDFD